MTEKKYFVLKIRGPKSVGFHSVYYTKIEADWMMEQYQGNGSDYFVEEDFPIEFDASGGPKFKGSQGFLFVSILESDGYKRHLKEKTKPFEPKVCILDKLIDTISDAPDSQISLKLLPRIKALKGVSLKRDMELQEILDECAHTSEASDFAMNTMMFLHQSIRNENRRIYYEKYLDKMTQEGPKMGRNVPKESFDYAWEVQYKEKMELFHEYSVLKREYEDLKFRMDGLEK